MRALVVDDDEDMRDLIRTFIDRSAANVRVSAVASDGDEALKLWRDDKPDVVVLDMRMPDMSGLDVAQAILAEDPTQPIVLFSAYLHPGVLGAAERLGVSECVQKDDLRRLPEVLERHGRRA